MNVLKTGNVPIYRFNIFEQFHKVKHFVSGRNGGISVGPYTSLNIGFGTDDAFNNVLENRFALAESIGTPLDWFVFPQQTHNVNVEIVNSEHCGKGAFDRESAIRDTDALITNAKNTFIVVQVADCVPILLFDSDNSVVAAIHAGWRGTASEIVKATVNKMMVNFGSSPQNILAAIGPSIGPCCYEVGHEVYEKFTSRNETDAELFSKNGSGINLNLWHANRKQLNELGVDSQNIEIANVCTKCNHKLFFSSRYGKGVTGRFLAGIMLY